MSGMGLAGSFGAAAGAQSLEELLKQKFLEGEKRREGERAQQRDQQQASYQNESLGLQRASGERADARAAAADAAARRPIPIMRAGPSGVQSIGEAPAGSHIMNEPEPKPAPAPIPIRRVNPRTGKMDDLGDAPAGTHFVNEPAATPPQHGRFSFQPGTDANGKSVMYRVNTDNGEATLVDLGAGVTPGHITDAEKTLGLYAQRIEQSEPVLSALQHSIATMNPVVFAAQEKIGNPALQSAEFKQYDQAARNYIAATLRRESGAAISQDEFVQARRQYLPLPGDDPKTLAQKAQNRAAVKDNFARGAGGAYHAPAVPSGASGGGADPLGIR